MEEVRGLLGQFGTLGRTASQAVGYREAIAYLRGEMSLQETHRRVKVRTHQFARRQETWFRSLSECRRIEQRCVDIGRGDGRAVGGSGAQHRTVTGRCQGPERVACEAAWQRTRHGVRTSLPVAAASTQATFPGRAGAFRMLDSPVPG